MVDKSGLRVNQLVEIELDSYLYKGVFPSRIEEITSEVIYLGIPIRFGVLVPVQVGDKITVNYIHDQEAYCFKTRVLGRKREPLPVLVAELPREIIKIQRRNHVRLEISLPVYLRALEEKSTISAGRTIDISGGGILLVTSAEWPRAQDLIWLRIELPRREPVICKARVVRTNRRQVRGVNRYYIACQFEDIREGQRDLIVGFIFARQRELIRRGLL